MIENEIFSGLPLKSHNAYFRNIATSLSGGSKKEPERVLKSAVYKLIADEFLTSFLCGSQLHNDNLLINMQIRNSRMMLLLLSLSGLSHYKTVYYF